MKGLFAQIYDIVAQIPPGKVISYGQIARILGRARGARVVGYALAAAPGGLPCHRVIKMDGSLPGGQAFGGAGVQRALLEAEGVKFLPDGRVDMGEHNWLGVCRLSLVVAGDLY